MSAILLESRILYSASPVTIGSHGESDSGFSPDASIDQLSDLLDSYDSPVDWGDKPLLSADSNGSTIQAGLELVFVDANIADRDSLVADILGNTRPDRDVRLILLDGSKDGIQQISDVLNQFRYVDALHFVSHAEGASIQLGNTWLGNANLGDYANQLQTWGLSLSDGADLLIYGCNLAGSIEGQSFLESLGNLTHTDIAASTNDTGHAVFGGDWDLEYSIGAITTESAFSAQVGESWLGKLAVINVTSFLDVVDGNVSSVAALLSNRGADGFISLREAVLAVNAGAGGDTINLAAGTYTLTRTGASENLASTGDLDLRKNMSIAGVGAGLTIIDGGGIDRVFHVVSGVSNLTDLTVRGGNANVGSPKGGGGLLINSGASAQISNVNFSGNSAADGGAIENEGTLGLIYVTVDGNTASGKGGGINNTGSLTVSMSTISNNTAQGSDGGGINVHQGSLSATNVTISGNSSSGSGGGISVKGPTTLQNVTITNNTANVGSGVHIQGGGAVDLGNTIIAGNNNSADVNGTFNSLGNNLIGNTGTAIGFIHGINGDQAGTLVLPIDPLLGPLQNNGGQADTHALLAGSPAINAGSASGAPASDQRGFARAGATDIGAFEFTPSPNSPPTNINPNSFSVNENVNTAGGLSLGILTAVDPDAGETFSYSIVPGGDGLKFSIGGAGANELILTDGVLDFETKSTYSVTIQVMDSVGNTYNENLTFNVNDQNDAPINTVPPGQSTAVNTPLVFSAGNGNLVAISDIDAGSNNVQVTLTTTNGTVTLNWPSGIAVPSGGEFRVNTLTADDQALRDSSFLGSDFNSPRSVAVSTDGSFVITWSSKNQDGSGWGVYAQRYDASGIAQGSEFRINSTTTNDQAYSTVAIDDSGNFVIAWTSKNQDGDGWGVFGRRFGAAGTALSGEFRINTVTNKNQVAPAIAMDDVGNFVVTWSSDNQDGDKWGVYAKRYNSAGTVLGGEFRVNNTTSKEQLASSVAMASDGSFVVSWSSKDQDGDEWGVYAKRYNSAGIPQGSEFRVNTVTSESQAYSSVAMDANGNFVVTWSSDDQDGDEWGVYGKRFNASGFAQGSEFRVNTTTNKEQWRSSVSMDNDGDFVITWTSEDQDGSGTGVYARQYTAAGVPRGGETLVNSTTSGNQDYSSVSMDAKGNFVVAWSGKGTGDNQGVYGKRFVVPTSLAFSFGDGTRDVTTTFTGAITEINRVIDGLVFVPNTGFDGPATLTVTTNDLGNSGPGGPQSDSDLININVGNGNVAPAISLSGVSWTYTENDPPTVIDPGITISDPDSADFNAGTLDVLLAGNGETADRLAIRNQGAGIGQVGISGSSVTFNFGSGPVVIGSFLGGEDGLTPLQVTFNSNATLAVVQAVARNVTFENASQDPSELMRTAEFIISDGDGGISAERFADFSVVATNDSPTIVAQTFSIAENSLNGTVVGVVVATDPDPGAEGVLSWSITGGTGASAFSINSSTGKIKVADQAQLDFESTSTFTLQVQASDGGTPSLNSSATITINLLDVNETPVIANQSINLNENSPNGTVVGTVAASDVDAGANGTLSYSITGGTGAAAFAINSSTGQITVANSSLLNFETTTSFTLTVRVRDGGTPSLNRSATVTINLLDVNESPTRISPDSFNIASGTNTSGGLQLFSLVTTDPDSGDSFGYSIVPGADAPLFSIGGAGIDRLILDDGVLNEFIKNTYVVNVRVTDSGGLSHVETITVRLTGTTNPPTDIVPASVNINENIDTSGGRSLVKLSAVDPDIGDTFSYSIRPGLDSSLFSIGGSGADELVLDDGLLDFESRPVFSVMVRVTDSRGFTFDKLVTVSVNDLNEAPTINLTNPIAAIAENTNTATSIKVADILVSDDALGTNTLSLGGVHAGTFMIVGGNELHLKPGVVLDYETLNLLSVSVFVDDPFVGGSPDDSAVLVIAVTDVNESPVAANDSYVANSGPLLVTGPGVLANDHDPEGVALIVSAVTLPVNGSLTFNADGSFQYVPAPGFVGTETFVYRISDGSTAPGFATVTIDVQGPGVSPSKGGSGNNNPVSGNDKKGSDAENPVEPGVGPAASTRTVTSAGNESSSDSSGAASETTVDNPELIGQKQAAFYSVRTTSKENVYTGYVAGMMTATATTQTTLAGSLAYVITESFIEAFNGLREEAGSGYLLNQAIVGSTMFVSTSLSIGYVIWLIRGGVLLSTVLSSMPAWRMIDPLPVLGFVDDQDGDAEDDSLETLVAKSNSAELEMAKT